MIAKSTSIEFGPEAAYTQPRKDRREHGTEILLYTYTYIYINTTYFGLDCVVDAFGVLDVLQHDFTAMQGFLPKPFQYIHTYIQYI